MRREIAVGSTFLAISLFFLIFGLQLPMGTARRIGPGVMPASVALMLMLLGMIILAQGFLRGSERRVARVNWRGLTAISASILVFAFALHPLGMILTTILAVLCAGLAEKPFRPLETLLLGVFLSLASVGIFIYGIGMRILVWPGC
ncbi:tripartite tricarboxylate transporter TctB family protein [Paracoccus acridae]|nr:tripartite tricarboxylate transporter TctB family protein [Paracoccus acridae]